VKKSEVDSDSDSDDNKQEVVVVTEKEVKTEEVKTEEVTAKIKEDKLEVVTDKMDEDKKADDKSSSSDGEEDDEDEEETPKLPVWGAVLLLAAVTALVSWLADKLVDSIQIVTASWGIPVTFVGVILLPIVGNAAEHVTSVSVAMKDKMDLSIGVAIGSSIQIALFVIPFLVILGWIIGQPMTLFFRGFETVVLFISVIIVNGCISDGQSNYLEGLLLFSAYFIIATSFFFASDTIVAV